MKTRLTIIITTLLFAFATVGNVQAEENKSDFDVAENIIEAVKNIDIVSLNVLLAEGATVDTVDEAGNTPLMLAAKIGNPRMLDIILRHNPQINERNNDGNTALMISSEMGVVEISRTLIKHGADLSMKNSDGLSPVQIALRHGHRDIAKLMRSEQEMPVSR